jgi:two-component system response regulator YesN
MYSVLIVDDEVHAVKAIESAIDWSKLQISEVYTAYNIRQAKDIFDKQSVDLMLCDIEMPQGSGLELLEWVREHYPKTESVFLTCHADFHFAKQAMKLGSLDYILKPIPYAELEKVIASATAKIDKDSELAQFSEYGQHWFKQQPIMTERFWLDVLNQTIPASESAIKEASLERFLPYSEHMRHLPLLVSVQHWRKKLSMRDEKIMEMALRNAAAETILDHGTLGHLVQWEKDKLLVLIPADNLEQVEWDKLRECCSLFIAACNAYFYCEISCYIGEPVPSFKLSAMARRLADMDQNNVAHSNIVLSTGESSRSSEMKLPDLSLWAVLLKEGSTAKLQTAIYEHLQECIRTSTLDAKRLHTFQQDFLQMMYYMLQLKGIQAHQLFGDDESIELSGRAARSVTDMCAWTSHIVDKATDYARSVEDAQNVVDRVISYIKQNQNKEITREELANLVFLNPDYLTRIFKKKTGLSISDYLLQERLQVAKELLVKTDMSVSAIALHVGYANFSHFSRMFKKYAGVNPLEYRQTSSPKQHG